MPLLRLEPLRAAAGLTLAAVLSTACSGSSAPATGHHPDRKHQKTTSPSPTPHRSPTPSHGVEKVSVGTPVAFEAQRGVALRLSAAKPSSSTTRLSSTYGYPPANGYYVTFELTITNTGSRPVILGPHDFFVLVPGQQKTTSYDGNAPYSGADRQLDTTQIDPKQRINAPLTFDVRTTHGTLTFAPDQKPAIVWSF